MPYKYNPIREKLTYKIKGKKKPPKGSNADQLRI